MYEAVYPHPEGESTASRLALTASEYGFAGVVLRRERPPDDEEGPTDAEAASAVDGCTSFGIGPEASADGHTYVGQNWDWIPAVEAFVKQVDLEAGRIEIDPIEGLL